LTAIPYCFRSKRKAQKEGTQQILSRLENIWPFPRQPHAKEAVRAYGLGIIEAGPFHWAP
jgi:hypothetical protein